MAPKKSKKTMGKKDLKRTKGGLLPAVNQTLNFNTAVKIQPALKVEDLGYWK